MSQIELLMGDMLCLYVGDGRKNFRVLSQYLAGCAAYLCFGPYRRENGSKKAKYSSIFKIGLILAQKWKPMTEMSTPKWWGRHLVMGFHFLESIKPILKIYEYLAFFDPFSLLYGPKHKYAAHPAKY